MHKRLGRFPSDSSTRATRLSTTSTRAAARPHCLLVGGSGIHSATAASVLRASRRCHRVPCIRWGRGGAREASLPRRRGVEGRHERRRGSAAPGTVPTAAPCLPCVFLLSRDSPCTCRPRAARREAAFEWDEMRGPASVSYGLYPRPTLTLGPTKSSRRTATSCTRWRSRRCCPAWPCCSRSSSCSPRDAGVFFSKRCRAIIFRAIIL